jgi:cullin 3
LSFEELYRNAYKIVLKKKGDVLYERVSLLEESWLRDTIRVKINQFVTSSIILGAAGESFAGQSTERRIAGERFMRELKDAFSDHQLCMGMITDVLMYMVRISSSPSLQIQCQSWDVGRDYFIVYLFLKQLTDYFRTASIVKTNAGLRFSQPL